MSLTTSLIAYWKLDEASGNALDAVGSNNLTETNGPIAPGTGIINGDRTFVSALSQYFTIADNTDLSTGDIDFTVQAWVKAATFPSFPGIMGKWNGGASQKEYVLYYDSGVNKFGLFVSSDGSADSAGVFWSSTASTATWYHILAWHDSVNNLLGIAVNDGTPVTTSYSSGVHDGTAAFNLAFPDLSGAKWDGQIDECAFWKRMLTSGERTSLYNGGAGFAYPFSASYDGSLFPHPELNQQYNRLRAAAF